MYAGKEVNF